MKRLLTPAELADTLGLSVQTVYNRIHDSECGPLPPIIRLSPKSHPRFARKVVEAWVEEKNGAYRPSPLAARTGKRGRPTKTEQIARRAHGRVN